ncbi:MAG: flavocytochrome c [Campylobacteraceae bacterium]
MVDSKRRNLLKSFAIFGGGALLFPNINLHAKMLESEVPKWDEDWDVIVVGSGFAGSSAMVSALDEGIKNILMIDKMQYLGGNSTFSGGSFAISGTYIQKQDGIEDNPELHIQDTLKSGKNLNDPELVRIMAYEGLESFNWLTANGVKWKWVSRSGGHTVPRSHSAGAGSYIVRPLQQRIKDLGGVVRNRVIMDEVVYNSKGTVIGIKVREKYEFIFDRDGIEADNKSGIVKYYRVNGGLILATGGWGADKKFRQQMVPSLRPDMLTTNHMGATGYTIQKLMNDGIKTIDMQYIQSMHVTSADEKSFGFAYRFITRAYGYGIMVNAKTGLRFVNEITDRRNGTDAILAMNENGANPPILITDSVGVKTTDIIDLQRGMEANAVWQFETLDELIDYFKINREPFLAQLKRYNEYVRSGVDPEFGRNFSDYKGEMITVEKPPFFAARPGPKVHHCMGGVKTTTKCQVINNDGDIVNGLFAAGEVTGGRHGYNRLGSNAVLDCILFGRVAGKAAADRYKLVVRG